jgi:alpha-tubulin suppressor-like RCC1 family protein
LCWGEGGDGQCGQGAYESVDTPVLVPDIDDAIEVSAGKVSACALRASGEVLCWGQNGFGQIGDGTTNSTNLAVAVEGLGPHGTCAACDDQNPCTINYCVPDAQCASEAVPDGTPCSTDMMCAAGECSESSPIPHNTIAVGEYFAAAVRIDGTVVTWGGNTHGQLGSGELNTLLRTAPNDVVGLSDVVSLVSGDDHLCALTSNATVYCWGLGNNGQLGNGGNIASPSVTAVSNLNDVVQIAASASSTCALKSNGSVWCWGLNLQKQLGTPAANVLENIPIQVDSITDAVRIGSGSEHFCAIRKGGELRCWGQGSGGSLGNGSSNNADTPVVVFPGIAGLRHTTSITGGGNLTCALNAVDNSPVCWGSASYGQLGDNSGSSSVTPVPLSELSGQTWLKTGRHHSCSLGPTGQLTCWGRNSEGQLALGNLSNTPSPTTIPTVGPVKEVAAGPYNTCIRLAADDTIYCTGRNLQGQVGDGTTTSRVSLVKVQGLSTYGQCADCQDSSPCTTSFCGPDSCLVTTAADTTPCGVQETCTSGQCNNSPPSHSRLAAGFSHTCALTSSGVVKCWGSNAYGQTGTGAQTNLVTEPTSVNGTSGVHITAKGFSTCVLTADGGAPVMCWGRNHAGQLGNGTGLNSYNPATVVGVNDFVSVDLGSSHGCGLRVNGGVECWGLDNSGQLGNGGTAATQASPSAVVLSAAAAQISAGYEHSCAVLAGGQAICWGEGSFGRLGYGGSADQQLPQQVAPGQALLWEARQVVAAKNHSCAVSSTGSVTCWGNGPEQLANVASSTTPQFSPLQNIARLAAGLTHTCGIDESEQLWCWGNNLNGQIGNDTFDTPDAPYMLPLTGVTDVTTGGKHTCAFADGGLYCWGSNESQQLGVTTPTATQKVPILVPGW